MARQSYWLPQPSRRCIITVFKSSSGCFTYRSSPCYRFSIIRSVSDLSYSDRPLTPLIRFRRSPQYTFKSKHTPCHPLCNFSFHKGRSSASSCGILPRFASVGCLHRWHCWPFIVGFETGQFYRSKWRSTSSSILLPSSTLDPSFIQLVNYIYTLL